MGDHRPPEEKTGISPCLHLTTGAVTDESALSDVLREVLSILVCTIEIVLNAEW